jgi:hypothetical protein
MIPTYNSSTQETEAEGRSVQSQPGLHSETLSQETNKQKPNKQKTKPKCPENRIILHNKKNMTGLVGWLKW